MAGLRALAARVNSRLNASLIATEDSDVEEDIPYWIPTGSLVLDFFLGGGRKGVLAGWAGNRIVELFAAPNVGKTALGYASMHNAQQMKGVAILADTERQHTNARARQFGVSTDLDDNFMYGTPDNLGEAWLFFETICESGELPPRSLAVFDSLSSTEEGYVLGAKDRAKAAKEATHASPEEEEPTDEEDGAKPASRAEKSKNKKGGVARRPQQVREGLRKLGPALARSGVTLLVINHSVLGFVGQFHAVQESGGGDAFKFWASQSVRLDRAGKWQVGNEERGKLVRPMMAKTRVAPPPSPHYKYMFPLTPWGVPTEYELYEFLRENKIYWGTEPGKGQVAVPASRHKIYHHGLGMFETTEKEEADGFISFWLKDLTALCTERPDIIEYMKQMAFFLGDPG